MCLSLVVVFLMLASLSLPHVQVETPSSSLLEPAPALATQVLEVLSDDQFRLNARTFGQSILPSVLRRAAGLAPQPVLMVRGGKELKFGQIRAVVDEAHRLGIRDVRLVLSSEEPEKTAPRTP